MLKIKHILITLLFIISGINHASAFEVVVTATPYQQAKYHALLNGRSCQNVNNYIDPNAFRITIELVVLCKALNYGGLAATLKFESAANYSRALLDVKKGNVVMPAATSWADDIDEMHLYKTDPIFAPTEFVKGIFTTPKLKDEIERKIAQAVRQGKTPLSVFQSYSFISNKLWQEDWQIIKKLQFPAATTAKINTSICKIIEAQRVSLYLGELIMLGINRWGFPCDNIQLVPIEGFKIEFNSSRHYAVSKQHPNGELIFNALQRGIKKMRDTGEMQQAHFPIAANKATIDSWINLNEN